MYTIVISDQRSNFHMENMNGYDKSRILTKEYKTNQEYMNIVQWVLESDIKYHSECRYGAEFWYMGESDAMKFKLKWL